MKDFASTGGSANLRVNDVPIDKFGMGSLPEFFDDPVRLEDILFSAKDVTGESSVEVCSCGETKKHKVPLKWNPKMESPVPQITEPAFASLDYEQFGEVTIAPLTMNLDYEQFGEVTIAP